MNNRNDFQQKYDHEKINEEIKRLTHLKKHISWKYKFDLFFGNTTIGKGYLYPSFWVPLFIPKINEQKYNNRISKYKESFVKSSDDDVLSTGKFEDNYKCLIENNANRIRFLDKFTLSIFNIASSIGFLIWCANPKKISIFWPIFSAVLFLLSSLVNFAWTKYNYKCDAKVMINNAFNSKIDDNIKNLKDLLNQDTKEYQTPLITDHAKFLTTTTTTTTTTKEEQDDNTNSPEGKQTNESSYCTMV